MIKSENSSQLLKKGWILESNTILINRIEDFLLIIIACDLR